MQASKPSLVFDHIAVLARSLEEGADYVRSALGVDMPTGGAHPRMGTHNLLMSLGPDCFLEVIAIDPGAASPTRPRWFGLDNFDGKPRLGAWVLGARNIGAALDGIQSISGPAIEMTRGHLRWSMSVREDGELPLSGAFPKLLQWPEGAHVASKMGDLGCRFESLKITSPEAHRISDWLDGKLDDPRIQIERGETSLTAVIETPSGLRMLNSSEE